MRDFWESSGNNTGNRVYPGAGTEENSRLRSRSVLVSPFGRRRTCPSFSEATISYYQLLHQDEYMLTLEYFGIVKSLIKKM